LREKLERERERERERESERGRDLGAARFGDAGLGADLEQVEREDSGVFFVPDNRRRYCTTTLQSLDL
jgi:hypothetical protein